MQEKIQLNYHLLDWVTTTIKVVIESTIEEQPEKMSTFISVNNMLKNLDIKTEKDLAFVLSEPLIEKMMDEIRNNI